MALIRAEIAAGMTPEELAASDELHTDNSRAIQHRLELITAELEAHRG
jgi:hypothetical protein